MSPSYPCWGPGPKSTASVPASRPGGAWSPRPQRGRDRPQGGGRGRRLGRSHLAAAHAAVSDADGVSAPTQAVLSPRGSDLHNTRLHHPVHASSLPALASRARLGLPGREPCGSAGRAVPLRPVSLARPGARSVPAPRSRLHPRARVWRPAALSPGTPVTQTHSGQTLGSLPAACQHAACL